MIKELSIKNLGIGQYNNLLEVIKRSVVFEKNTLDESNVRYSTTDTEGRSIVQTINFIRRNNNIQYKISRWSMGMTKTKNTRRLFANILVSNKDKTSDFYWFVYEI